MAKAKSKGATAEKPGEVEQAQGEAYKGWRSGKGGPLVLSDEIKAEIDTWAAWYCKYTDAGLDDTEMAALDGAASKLAARGLERDERNDPKFFDEFNGWKGKPDATFSQKEYDELSDMTNDWLRVSDEEASTLAAVMIQRGLEKTEEADDERAEQQIRARGWALSKDWKTKTWEATLGKGKAKKELEGKSPVEVLAAIDKLDGKPAPAEKTAEIFAPAPTNGTHAAGDAHAAASLAEHGTLRAEHEEHKAHVAERESAVKAREMALRDVEAESKAGRPPEVARHISAFVADRKARIESLLHGDFLEAEDIKTVQRLQERVKVYHEDIAEAAKPHLHQEIEHAKAALVEAKEALAADKEALGAFEASHPLFTKLGTPDKPRDATAPGNDAPLKAETKAKAGEAKDKLDQALEAEATKKDEPAKPKSEGARKLEALLTEPSAKPTSAFPPEIVRELEELGFTRTEGVEPSKARVEEAIVGWRHATGKKAKKHLAELAEQFAGWGWILKPSAEAVA